MKTRIGCLRVTWLAIAVTGVGLCLYFVFSRLPTPQLVRVWHVASPGHADYVAFSPDGQRLALAGGGPNGFVEAWEVRSSRLEASRQFKGFVFNLAFSPDGRLIACAEQPSPAKGPSGTVRLLDATDLHVLASVRCADWGHFLAFSPDGSMVTGQGPSSSETVFWSVPKLRVVRHLTLTGPTSSLLSVHFVGPHWLLAAASNSIRLVDDRTGSDYRRFAIPGASSCLAASLSRDSSRVAGLSETDFWVSDTTTGREVMHVSNPTASFHEVCISPSGRAVVVLGRSGWSLSGFVSASIWDVERERPVAQMSFRDWANGVDISPDGNLLAISDAEGNVSLFRMPVR